MAGSVDVEEGTLSWVLFAKLLELLLDTHEHTIDLIERHVFSIDNV